MYGTNTNTCASGVLQRVCMEGFTSHILNLISRRARLSQTHDITSEWKLQAKRWNGSVNLQQALEWTAQWQRSCWSRLFWKSFQQWKRPGPFNPLLRSSTAVWQKQQRRWGGGHRCGRLWSFTRREQVWVNSTRERRGHRFSLETPAPENIGPKLVLRGAHVVIWCLQQQDQGTYDHWTRPHTQNNRSVSKRRHVWVFSAPSTGRGHLPVTPKDVTKEHDKVRHDQCDFFLNWYGLVN